MLITEEIIIKSFKIYGISNNLDGYEDEMFHWPEDINPDIADELPNTIQSDSENDDEESED